MALFRKGILSAWADSIAMSAEISAARDKQDLLVTTAENLQLIGELADDEKLARGIQASTNLVEVIKSVNKML